MTHAIILKALRQGTKTFKFNGIESAQQFAKGKMNRLVDIMEWNGQEWKSILLS